VHHRYEWLYVYGFVRPATGESFWLILPTVNKELFSAALSEFCEWVGAGAGKSAWCWPSIRRVGIPART
jgi:hypothetical protein